MTETATGAASGADRSTPLGVKLVSAATAVVGTAWASSGFAATDPSVGTVVGPTLGLAAVLVAVGLWERNWLAWALAVTAGGGFAALELLRLPATGRLPAAATAVAAVAYLLVRRRWFRSARTD